MILVSGNPARDELNGPSRSRWSIQCVRGTPAHARPVSKIGQRRFGRGVMRDEPEAVRAYLSEGAGPGTTCSPKAGEAIVESGRFRVRIPISDVSGVSSESPDGPPLCGHGPLAGMGL